jgi:hypothetical protein
VIFAQITPITYQIILFTPILRKQKGEAAEFAQEYMRQFS